MNKIDYNDRTFRSLANTSTGDVGSETVFHYHQEGDIVWAEYAGSSVARGQLIGTVNGEDEIDMRYSHVTTSGELKTGVCHSRPEILADGRIRLNESWHWTCGDGDTGESIVEELANLG